MHTILIPYLIDTACHLVLRIYTVDTAGEKGKPKTFPKENSCLPNQPLSIDVCFSFQKKPKIEHVIKVTNQSPTDPKLAFGFWIGITVGIRFRICSANNLW